MPGSDSVPQCDDDISESQECPRNAAFRVIITRQLHFANSTHIQTPNHSTQFIVQAKNHCGITLAREARRTKRTPSHAFMSSFDSYFDHYYSSSVRSAENVFWLILRPEAPLGHPAGLSWCHDGGTEVFFISKSAQIILTSVSLSYLCPCFDTNKIKADVQIHHQ